MTMFSGGLQANVVPPELTVVFDMRVSPKWPLEQAKIFLDTICAEAGSEVKYEYLQYSNITALTPLTDDNIWWTTFKKTCDNL